MCPTSIAVWKQVRHRTRGTCRPRRARGCPRSAARSRARPRRRAGASRRGSRPRRTAPRGARRRRSTSTPTPDGAERASAGAEGRPDLLVGRRAEVAAEHPEHLRLGEPVVAPDETEDERPVGLDHGHRLRRGRAVDPEQLRERLDRRDAGRLDLLRRVAASGARRHAGRRARSRDPPRSRRSRT